MEETQLGWNDSTDILQGIMVGHEGQDPSDPKSSNVPFDLANPLLDLQLGSLDPTLNHSLLSQWPTHYSQYTHSRLTGDQDAWNPLLATGVPATSSISHMNMPSQMPDQDCCFSQHYSESSESGSQYMDSYHSADSGYGGTSCTTQSAVASSYSMDSSSPQMDMADNMSAGSGPLFGHPKYGSVSEASYTSEFVASPSQLVDASMRCEHPSCKWVGKCPSDKRKHEARHKKLFKCDVPNCPRKDGFGTINDLARHKKCVHNKEPERGPKMMYMCFGTNCPRPNKRWPRLDNFKQHLNRMHHEEDGEELLKKSMDWYEKVILRQPEQSLDNRSPIDNSVFETQDDEMSVQSAADVELEYGSTSQQKTNIFTFGAATPRPPQYGTPSLADSVPSQFPAFASLGLSTSQASSAERGITRPDGSVTDAADNLINAMTKMMNNRSRRSSQHTDEGVDLEVDAAQLSQPQRQMLQKVLSVALERLSDDNEVTAQDPDTEKRGWFQCDACPKQTRLRCEMKKHQKRHERPYGCTFPHCAKSFGSKADWKRHESSQHLSVPSWFCTEHDVQTGASCERLFYRPETYTHHLHQHGIHGYQVAASAGNNRLDLAGQSHFWCGFCNCRVPLRNHGPEASDERFNHIDIEHFKKGERGQDWRFPSSSLDGDEMDQTRDLAVQTFDHSRKAAVIGERKRKYAAA
ncbi:Zinc finger C2H2 [Penicillium cf. griseofulvum]|uniref:Zinc finger C2H2 n=1 Tax=Penicillium cf. griseofulvum TaxID=2972120 RepID=A0A9W9JSH1_9EURO|nr:Zinc finger C2H2 [Penicillium cf. griseofulvum]KAJ5424351.1 Zinc finger C2H2 [Penicillium cf. griseofulvum]KAJ5442407.1 Zinc finger C2H2 [Penicillium cf. griseofulvum]